mmetsp:Transcript_16582/g.25790  ORF Transcript_16582/g.25790 Transcript_16582/m.25790 type:complete len:106 (-) Transcript_16582:193-510(-)
MSSNYVVCGSDELVYGTYGDHASAFAQAQSLANAMASQSPNASVQENADSCVVIKTVEKQRNVDDFLLLPLGHQSYPWFRSLMNLFLLEIICTNPGQLVPNIFVL